MMAEYIEREAVKRLAYRPRMFDEIAVVSVDSIDKIPAAEVVEVKHGRWVICSDGYYPYCSECKEEPYRRNNADLPKFCPNYGAKMDGE